MKIFLEAFRERVEKKREIIPEKNSRNSFFLFIKKCRLYYYRLNINIDFFVAKMCIRKTHNFPHPQ